MDRVFIGNIKLVKINTEQKLIRADVYLLAQTLFCPVRQRASCSEGKSHEFSTEYCAPKPPKNSTTNFFDENDPESISPVAAGCLQFKQTISLAVNSTIRHCSVSSQDSL